MVQIMNKEILLQEELFYKYWYLQKYNWKDFDK